MRSTKMSVFWYSVKQELSRRGQTLEDLASFLEIEPTLLNNWTFEDTLPIEQDALRIAEFLETTVEFLTWKLPSGYEKPVKVQAEKTAKVNAVKPVNTRIETHNEIRVGKYAEDTFWNNVRVCLKKRGLLQEDLANAIGVKHVVVRLWFSRNTPPSASNAVKIARFLETNIDSLIGPVVETTPLNYAIGDRIRNAMKSKDLDVQTLSTKADVLPSTIRAFLHLDNPPEEMRALIELSKTLEVSLEYLIGLKREKTPRVAEIERLAGLLGEDEQDRILWILNCAYKAQSR